MIKFSIDMSLFPGVFVRFEYIRDKKITQIHSFVVRSLSESDTMFIL